MISRVCLVLALIVCAQGATFDELEEEPADPCSDLTALMPSLGESYCEVVGQTCLGLAWIDSDTIGRAVAGKRWIPVTCASATSFVNLLQSKRTGRLGFQFGMFRPKVGPPALHSGQRGFVNIGNVCYLNAVLQLLTHSRPLRNLMADVSRRPLGSLLKTLPKGVFRADALIGVELANQLSLVFGDMWRPNKPSHPQNPWIILEMLQRIANYEQFQLGRMEDAHETLRKIFTYLSDGFLGVTGKDILGGLFSLTGRKQRTCHHCGEVTVKDEKIQDLLIPIPKVKKAKPEVKEGEGDSKKVDKNDEGISGWIKSWFISSDEQTRTDDASDDYIPPHNPLTLLTSLITPSDEQGSVPLARALVEYLAPETLEEVQCEPGARGHPCMQLATADIVPSIVELPEVLLITLNRFRADGLGKILTTVAFGTEFDFSDLAGFPDTPYRLVGVVHHEGPTQHVGHYVTEFRHPDSHQWFLANDNAVTPIAGPTTQGPTPYILMFERVHK